MFSQVNVDSQESQNFYLLDVYAVCDGDREEEIQVLILE